MVGKKKSDLLSWAVMFGIVLLLLEVTFFNRGLIFSLLVASGMIYIGRKRQPKTSGKFLFWAGTIFFILSVFNMMTIKVFLFGILGYLIFQFAKSKRSPEKIQPEVVEAQSSPPQTETIVKKTPLFDNTFFGEQRTKDHVYEWNDINIQTGIGDTIIDLSYTVLPKGETIIFVRGLVGNIQIQVPYDVEVCVNHSVLAGSSNILNVTGDKLFNQRLHVQTSEYEKADQKVKIFTSMLVGDLEVKRV
ncbi:cell wall-active antibiotics response protein LiaF [Robertmurraya sp. FSL R5-0851]|uniref:cell wall-active antibiotics response protein LiaF n=1 Tax=Robertmurraya sp. FSL R5-0851 TaxID=2921584 RepID=UPI0030FA6203